MKNTHRNIDTKKSAPPKPTCVYHYSACAQLNSGSLELFDGIATWDEPITTYAALEKLKALIPQGKFDPKKLNIISLTRLQ